MASRGRLSYIGDVKAPVAPSTPRRLRSPAPARAAARAAATAAVLVVLLAGRPLVGAGVPAAASPDPATGDTLVFRGGPARVVEFYTSQGCRSCPPAEAWLARLVEHPRLWRGLFPLAFHVDLWDHLGWADRLARTAFTERLRDYAARWNDPRIYTPEFVVDGAEWRGYFDGARPGDLVPEGVDADAGAPRVDVRVHEGFADVVVSGPAAWPAVPYVEVAVLGFGISQYVARGENAGRTLEHAFAVVGFDSAYAKWRGGAWHARLRARAVKDVQWKRLALVASVRAGPLAPPRAAAGGWITPRHVELVWSEGGAVDDRDRIERSDEQWRRLLSPEQYRVLREQGTERAFTGAYWDHHEDGVYVCAACGQPLFDSRTKFDSGTGWPSFVRPVDPARIDEARDLRYGMVRTEVRCARCGGHLGHVFDDGPRPTGLRYCINSVSLRFVPREAPGAKTPDDDGSR